MEAQTDHTDGRSASGKQIMLGDGKRWESRNNKPANVTKYTRHEDICGKGWKNSRATEQATGRN